MKTVFAFAFAAFAASSSVEATATHRRTGTELFRVQPAKEVMPLTTSAAFQTFSKEDEA